MMDTMERLERLDDNIDKLFAEYAHLQATIASALEELEVDTSEMTKLELDLIVGRVKGILRT